MVQSLILAYLVWIQAVRYWHIAILALIFGLAQTLDLPVRQSFYVELVGKDDLMNAISLNSTVINLAKVVGPSVAGILLVKMGATACFFINGISFIPVIYGLYKIKTQNNILRRNHENKARKFGADLCYRFRSSIQSRRSINQINYMVFDNY
jgi:predicted MFS family arabinose efflux permease